MPPNDPESSSGASPLDPRPASPPSSESAVPPNRGLAARAGGVLIHVRGWLTMLAVFALVFIPARPSLLVWIVGAILVVAGAWIRLASLAAAGGTVMRRRADDTHRLVTHGPFQWVRNPIYLANLLIWTGFAVISGVWWLLPLVVGVFAIVYVLIARHEETVLAHHFGQEYAEYARSTRRWIPEKPARRAVGTRDWSEAWRNESRVLLALVLLAMALAIKQRVWWA